MAKIPDCVVVRAKAMEGLFARFDTILRDQGYLAMGGQIVDATIVEVPRQRNDDGEKAALKAGQFSVRTLGQF